MYEDQPPTQPFTPSGRLTLFLVLLLITILTTLCLLFCCRDFLKRMRNLKRTFTRSSRRVGVDTSDPDLRMKKNSSCKGNWRSICGKWFSHPVGRDERKDISDDPSSPLAKNMPQLSKTTQQKISNSFSSLFSSPSSVQQQHHEHQTQHYEQQQQQHEHLEQQQQQQLQPHFFSSAVSGGNPTKSIQIEGCKVLQSSGDDVDEAFTSYNNEISANVDHQGHQQQQQHQQHQQQQQHQQHQQHQQQQQLHQQQQPQLVVSQNDDVKTTTASNPQETIEARIHPSRKMQRCQMLSADPSTTSRHACSKHFQQDGSIDATHFLKKSPQNVTIKHISLTSHSAAESLMDQESIPVRSSSVSRPSAEYLTINQEKRKPHHGSHSVAHPSNGSFHLEEWWKCPRYRATNRHSVSSFDDPQKVVPFHEHVISTSANPTDLNKDHVGKKTKQKIHFNDRNKIRIVKMESNSDLRFDRSSKKVVIGHSFEVQSDKKWNSMELTESVFYERKSQEHGRRVRSYDYFGDHKDPFMITEFLDGPYHDEDGSYGSVKMKNPNISIIKSVEVIHNKPVLGVSFEEDTSGESHRSKEISLNKSTAPNLGPPKQKIHFQDKLEENVPPIEPKPIQKTTVPTECPRWPQETKLRRQTFSMSVIPPTRESTSSNTPHTTTGNGTNSFDSVATDHDASGSSSRCGVTTTSIESSATNASTDSTSDSKSHKLHQMRDDSGYKSLEAQQSLRKIETDPPWSAGPLTKTSQMFKFVAQKFKVTSPSTKSLEFFRSTAGTSASIEDSPNHDRNLVAKESSKQPIAHQKPSFLARRATFLFGSENPISSIFERMKDSNPENEPEKLDIPQGDSRAELLPNTSQISQTISPKKVDKVTRERPKLKIFDKIASEPNREAPSISGVRISSSLDGSPKVSFDIPSETLKIKHKEELDKHQCDESSETNITKSQSLPSSTTNSFFNRMLSKAELYISATKSQAESIILGFSGNIDQPGSPNRENLPRQDAIINPPSSDATPTTSNNSLRFKWKMAAKLVGESWNRNKSFPETVEKFSRRNFRDENSIAEEGDEAMSAEMSLNKAEKLISAKSESSSLPVIPTSERLQRILEQQKALRSKAIVSSFPEQTNDDKRLSDKPKLRQLEQIKQPQIQKSFQSVESADSQLVSENVKPSSLDSALLTTGATKPAAETSFHPQHTKLTSQIESIKRGEMKTASKKRRAYRDRKQKEELLDLESEDRVQPQRISPGSTSSPSLRLKEKTFASSSLSTSFDLSGNDEQEVQSSTSATTDDVTALTFVRQSTGRLVYRDYSVDAKTEAIFNEFLQFDPNLEPKTSKRRKSFNKETE